MMPKRATAQLPFDLEERRALHARAAVLGHFVFDGRPTVEPWRPPTIVDEIAVCPTLPPTVTSDVGEMQFANPLHDYNLRLANAASVVMLIAEALRIAGMTKQDLDQWTSNSKVAGKVQEAPLRLPPGDGHLYVYVKGYVGDYSVRYPRKQWAVTQRRLDLARGLFDRTATALNRILLTVGPEGVLNRLAVSRENDSVILDGRRYDSLRPNDTIFLYYLRLSGGDWLSSGVIEAAEGFKDFRVDRCRCSLREKHPELDHLIVTEPSIGSRIVLGLPPP